MKFLLFLVLVVQSPATEGVIAMPVQHKHTIGACEGTLVFSPDGVRYDTEEEDHQRSWSYADVKFFEIVSDDELRLHTFEDHGILRLGQDRKFVFEQVQGPLGVDFYNMLRERSPRPVVTHIVFPTDEIARLGAKHKHRLGGCQGTLIIGQNTIAFESDQAGDSSVWRLQDITTFGSVDPFHLRITTAFETYTFDLKEPLATSTYDHIWTAVYSPNVQSYRRRQP